MLTHKKIKRKYPYTKKKLKKNIKSTKKKKTYMNMTVND